MVERDNPAGRLWHILNDAKKKGANLRTREVWGEVFDIDKNSTSQILEKQGEVIHLLMDVKRSIGGIDGLNKDLYLRQLPSIENALANVRLSDKWEGFKNRLDDATMLSLAHCADKLSEYSNEIVLSQDDLQSLRKDVEALIDRILDGPTINPKLQEILLEHLEVIRRAIINYNLYGSKGLKEAVETATGAVYLNREIFEAEKDSEAVDWYWKIIVRIGTLTALVSDAHELAPGVAKLLES
ncbi:MAG: hypothetical protein GVY35_18325 [Bacteroidetes bacterium]|jgi:hypothetical protein|nr:hypothetical protein [Bacteroidota bacterium]